MGKGTVWVIGASSGLGLATARAFAKAGWLVVGGARSFDGGEQDGVRRLPLDVTDAASRARFAEAASAISPSIDALVYCAGVLSLGPCEAGEEYERVMNTNFFGLTRMVSLALTRMRAQGKGKIILFSSINGLLGIPFQSAYTASKHAIEGYAECLAMETRAFGVQVCLVEPGDHRGGSQRYRQRACAADSPYAAAYASACAAIDRDEAGGLSPDRLGEKVARNAARRKMRFRLRVAKPDQHLAVVVHDALPSGLSQRILRGYYLKKGKSNVTA